MVSSNQDIISISLYIHTHNIIDTILYKKINIDIELCKRNTDIKQLYIIKELLV